MNLRTITIWTTIVILIAIAAFGAVNYVVLTTTDTGIPPTDVLIFTAVAGMPLIVNLLFLRFSKNQVAGFFLLLAAVLYCVPIFVVLFSIYDSDPTTFDTTTTTILDRCFIPIACLFYILIPCWIVAYGVDVFFKVFRRELADATPPSDEQSQNSQDVPVTAPRTTTIRTTAVLLIALLALGALFSLLHGNTVGIRAFFLALFAGVPLIVNLSFLQFAKNRVSEISLLVGAVLYCVPVFFVFILIHCEDLTTQGMYPLYFLLLPISGVFSLVPCWLIVGGAEIYFRMTRSRTDKNKKP